MAQSTSNTSSRRHGRDHDSVSIGSSRVVDAEWEANEALRQRELEEARARAAQMEKTMRWWSDCTANWREKWSKVRNERNKVREEAKQLRTKLDSALKDATVYKGEKQELEVQNDELKREIERIHIMLLKHAGQFDGQLLEALGEDPLKEFSFGVGLEASPVKVAQNGGESKTSDDGGAQTDRDSASIEEYILQGAVPRSGAQTKEADDVTNGKQGHSEEYDEEFLLQKMSMLQLRLDQVTKTLQVERDEKTHLHRTIEKLTVELQEAKDKCEELREARQEAVRELLTLQDQHQEELRLLRQDLQDETNSRETIDRRVNDLRIELERLQAENAAEWGKSERLETEKLALERDNKKLRAELRDMQERIERKGRPIANCDTEVRHLQQELSDKNKEITELKHSQNKLKKMIQDKITELAHAVRRAEQYESEVKKLRVRVEELKRDLAVAEDEIDSASNNIRKLQRTNDELQEQVDNFQVQLQHLHTRLRNCSSSSLLSHRGNVLTEDASDEDLNEY